LKRLEKASVNSCEAAGGGSLSIGLPRRFVPQGHCWTALMIVARRSKQDGLTFMVQPRVVAELEGGKQGNLL
jgi:hypothetical protein